MNLALYQMGILGDLLDVSGPRICPLFYFAGSFIAYRICTFDNPTISSHLSSFFFYGPFGLHMFYILTSQLLIPLHSYPELARF